MSDQNKKRRNLALIAGILAIGLVAATIAGSQFMTAAAQQPQTQTTDDRSTVSTTGSGSVKVNPDKVSVNIGVETKSNTTAADATAANAKLMDKVRKGGAGSFGPVPMAPTGPDKIGDGELKEAIAWILEQG